MTQLSTRSNEQHLKTTSSLCPVCKAQVSAEVVQRRDEVFLRKHCDTHGPSEARISSNAKWYHLSLGADAGNDSACCGGASCCGGTSGTVPANTTSGGSGGRGGHDPARIETASTCIALIEIVESCNLECPTCYAGSTPPPEGEPHTALTLDDFKGRLQSVIERKGLIDILQLSGGEPTVHPEFFELMAWALKQKDIGYILLNTNGVRLANEPGFIKQLGELHARLRKFEVYLQYDGPQEAGQADLRGLDLRRVRQRVVDQCEKVGVPVTLAMTIDGHNVSYMGDTVRFALENKAVRGITLQPMFGSGRAYEGVNLTVGGEDQVGAKPQAAAVLRPPAERLSVADIVLGLIDQCDGLLSAEDFTPLPCGDPNCHTVGYLVRRPNDSGGERVVGVSSMIDLELMQGFLKDRINYDMEDLAKCGCESEELGEVLKYLEVGPDDVLRLFIKPFMDVWTYDQHRIDRCCVHVVGEGGSLDSFCRHYALQ